MKIVQYMLGIRDADGGVVRALVDLCNLLSGAGDEVIALTVDDRDAPHNWHSTQNRPRLHKLNASRALPVLLSRDSLARAERCFQHADAIHLHVPWDPTCAQLAKLALRMRIPYFVTIHGMLDDWTFAQKTLKKRTYLAMFGRKLLERAAAVQCTSQVEMEQSSKRYPRGRSAVVPLPFDLASFQTLPGAEQARQLWPQRPDTFTALAIGRLDAIKRIELLIEAAAIAKRQEQRIDVVVAGSGDPNYERGLRDVASNSGVSDRVHFVGFVKGLQKLSLYQAADVVVHPSAHENFGYATVESLACATPVITTKAVNIWPELEQSGGAMIVPPSAQGIVNAILELRDNPIRCQDMGNSGRNWIMQYLDPSRIVTLYQAMYRTAR